MDTSRNPKNIISRSLAALRTLTGRPDITQTQADKYFARVRKFKAENPHLFEPKTPNQVQAKNLEKANPEQEKQLKDTMDLEYIIARLGLNSMDHDDHSEYLIKIKDLEAAFQRKNLEIVQKERENQITNPKPLEQILKPQKENSEAHPSLENPLKLTNILLAMDNDDRASSIELLKLIRERKIKNGDQDDIESFKRFGEEN